MLAKTMMGFEPILAKELKSLGATEVTILNRAVSFEGDTGFMYKANLCLRTALKILKPIVTFRAKNEEALYDQMYKIAWEKYLDEDQSFAIDSVCFSDYFTHSHYVALKTKDALVDRFRQQRKRRPNVDTRFPDLKINVHIADDFCSVSLDSSGDSLHLRGYRLATNQAPMSEVLAAGLILSSDWNTLTSVYDPMCGSGTLLIEAAMIACNIPPNINRKEFGFMRWHDFDEDLFELIRTSALKKVKDTTARFYGADNSKTSVFKAKDNIKEAGLSEFIEVQQADFFETDPPKQPIQLFMNPPYGERLPVSGMDFFKQIGDTFKQRYAGCSAWILLGDLEAIKHIGLRPSRKIRTLNGKIECVWAKYEMYSGSKKQKHQS
ncbi:MAG: THUMP domain-containing protein [Flavobacteriaceae bacterium]|nr:THUMP domain-containing protein [Flavobacteriaceae bacterium]